MRPTRHLRLRLRLIEGALVLLFGALTCAAVATHQLLLDPNNRPTTDVSFSGSHWIGTLDAARLPASVPLFNAGGVLPIPHGLSASGSAVFDGGYIYTNGMGDFSVEGTLTAPIVDVTFLDTLSFSSDEGCVGSDSTGNVLFSTATLPPLDPSLAFTPSAGVTLYLSNVDGRLHYVAADGSDHKLAIVP